MSLKPYTANVKNEIKTINDVKMYDVYDVKSQVLSNPASSLTFYAKLHVFMESFIVGSEKKNIKLHSCTFTPAPG